MDVLLWSPLFIIVIWWAVQEKKGTVDRKKEEKVFYTTFKIMMAILSIICLPVTILLGMTGFKLKK